ncbi:FABP family protein [Luedemannella helvata]|uniref:Peroxynitrite isomerase n=1 Tax=Luedemannella helvata TaxID=349315 RepID=A0ABP4X7M5_9ACTN
MTEQDGRPAWLDAPVPEAYPFEETHDLRVGPDLHPALLGLLPFIGVWRGRGAGEYPTIEPFEFAQEIRISHDGRPFLHYESRAWIVDPQTGAAVRPAARETGWWRPIMGENGRATDEIEALLCAPTGIMTLHIGTITNVRVEMASDAVVRTSTAKEVTAEKRLYGIVDRDLLYAQDMAAVGQPLTSHLAAKLTRVAG